MPPKSDHTFIMAVHAIYAVGCLCKYKLVDPVFTHFTLEAMRVIGVVARHDSLVEDGEVADTAAVGAVCAYWRAVREKEEVGICRNLMVALGTFEAIDVEKGLPAMTEVRTNDTCWEKWMYARRLMEKSVFG